MPRKRSKRELKAIHANKGKKFMSYREYDAKQKEFHKQIKEANQKSDFTYSNMGRVDTSAEKKQQRLLEESEKLQKQAEAYDKKYPEWRKR